MHFQKVRLFRPYLTIFPLSELNISNTTNGGFRTITNQGEIGHVTTTEA
jgi:hypothetical protein